MSDTRFYECSGTGSHSTYRFPAGEHCPHCPEAHLSGMDAAAKISGIQDAPRAPKPSERPPPPWEFRPEDFKAYHYASPQANATGVMASIANQKLQEWLAQAPVVYCRRLSDNSDWHYFDNEAAPLDTHAGRLVCIEPLKAADTAESLLREVADTLKLGQGLDNGEFKRINGLIDRARKLLKEGE